MLIHGTRNYHCIEQSSSNDCMTLFQMVIISQMNYLTVMLPEIVQNMSLIRGIFIALHIYSSICVTLVKFMSYNPLHVHIQYICVYIFWIFHLFRRSSSSRSRSCSPEEPKKTKVEFITSFGGESDEEGVVQGPALPPQLNVSESPHTWSVPLNYVYMGIYNCREYK